MKQEISFYLENRTTAEVIANFSEVFDFEDDGSMYVKQIHCVGFPITGLQFTAQLHSNGFYEALIFPGSSTTVRTEKVCKGLSRIEYKHDNGDEYLYIIGID